MIIKYLKAWEQKLLITQKLGTEETKMIEIMKKRVERPRGAESDHEFQLV